MLTSFHNLIKLCNAPPLVQKYIQKNFTRYKILELYLLHSQDFSGTIIKQVIYPALEVIQWKVDLKSFKANTFNLHLTCYWFGVEVVG